MNWGGPDLAGVARRWVPGFALFAKGERDAWVHQATVERFAKWG